MGLKAAFNVEVNDEDNVINAAVQAGLSSPFVGPAILSHLELGLTQFASGHTGQMAQPTN